MEGGRRRGRQQAGGALRWQGNHPRVSHCLRRKPLHTQPSFSVWGQQDSTPEADREARAEGSSSLTLECGRPLVTPCGALPCDLVHRLECLQRIVSKLQMEAGLCEEQLNQADALLQSVRERGEAG